MPIVRLFALYKNIPSQSKFGHNFTELWGVKVSAQLISDHANEGKCAVGRRKERNEVGQARQKVPSFGGLECKRSGVGNEGRGREPLCIGTESKEAANNR